MIKTKAIEKYYRNLKEILHESPELKEEIERRVRWFKRNPNDTRLGNHELRKKMKGQLAFWITDDIRIVYEWTGKNEVCLLNIGGHPEVYGEK